MNKQYPSLDPNRLSSVVSFWPDEQEHEPLKDEYQERVAQAVAEMPRLAALLEMLQEVASSSIDKRVKKAVVIAQEKAGITDREEAMTSPIIRLLQLHEDTNPRLRAEYFKSAEQLPSTEIAARVRVGERSLVDDALVRACLTLLSVASTGLRDTDELTHDTGVKVIRTFGDSKYPAHAIITSNTRYKTKYHGALRGSPTIRVHSRQAGLLRTDSGLLSSQELAAVRILGNLRESVPYGDVDYEPFRARVADAIARDSELGPDEEPLIYPVTESVFFSRRRQSNF